MESVLNHLQALTAHPTTLIIPDIKATNALLHQLLNMLPSEPSLDTRLQKSPVYKLLQFLLAATST